MNLKLFILVHTLYIIGNNASKKVKRKEKINECGSILDIPECNGDDPNSLSRKEENIFKIKYESGNKCEIKKTFFDWTLSLENGTNLKFNDYQHRDIFKISPYWIGTGKHDFYVTVREVHSDSKETKITSDEACPFIIRPELPIPQITGGSEITANSDKTLVISGQESIDMDIRSGKSNRLLFQWACTVNGAKNNFCRGHSGSKPTLTIPADKALDGSVYNITLWVCTPETEWQRTTQIIHFKSDVPNIQIKCLKNCPPATEKTNSQDHIILQAKCVKYCHNVDKDSYKWSVGIPGFDYDKNTKRGRNLNIFDINANVLEVGMTYRVSVGVNDLPAVCSVEIEVHTPPKLTSCSISPTSGEALKTKFSVACQYPPGQYMFEIYSAQNGIDVLVDKGIKLEELIFNLGPGAKVKVRMIDEFRFSDQQFLDVKVEALLKPTGSNEDIEKEIATKYFGDSEISVDKLMEAKDFDKTIEVANSLVDEMEQLQKVGNLELPRKYYLAVLNYIEKMPIDTGTRARQLGALCAKISESCSSKPDPAISALATRICRKSADRLFIRLKSKRFPDSFSDETKESASILSKCAQASAESNLDILKAEETSPFSTPFPLLDVPVIQEDYPDYVDDQQTSKKTNQFSEASKNFVKICYINSKKLALTMSTQEETVSLQIKFFGLTSTLKIGHEIVGMEIESQRVTLVPSEDFSSTESTVHVAMCTSIKNIYWWVQQEEVFTSIAVIGFNVDEKPISRFQKPFKLTFETRSNLLSKVLMHESKTPRIPASNLPKDQYDFEKISLHRITSYRQQPFVVEFEDLASYITLDVMVTKFRKPTLNELRNRAIEINFRNNKLFIPNNESHDNWYYLVVLPNSKMNGSSVNYKFSVYSLSCYRWVESETKWKFGCKSIKSSSKLEIICECYNSSVLIGRLINNEVKQEETLFMEYELETQVCYIILVSVVIAFFLYCVFLSWFSVSTGEGARGHKIYFLSDVPSTCRYGYLVIVKTGNKSKASTTSNVAIKIYGTDSESKEHVLNYPDPEKRFLQKNQDDWFMIGTEHYLGDIEKIDLWFDSIGYRPGWFCSEVEIFDVQLNKSWLFVINKWFEILRNEQIIYTAYPVKSKDSMKKKDVAFNLLKKIPHAFRGPHMWDLVRCEEQALSRMKRLHILYSIFVTTYILGIFFYGCPKFQNSDSLVYTLNYTIDRYVVLSTLGCFIVTFAMHFPVVWFFRYPKMNVFGKYQKILKEHPISTDDLCWCFLIANIVISMTLLIILGFWVPHPTGLLWLTSVIISLLIYIFIMENVTRLIFNLTAKQQQKAKKVFHYFKSRIDVIEKQRAMLYKTFGDGILRPFFSHLYKPLDPFKVKEQKYWAAIRERLFEILEDLIMISIYVTLLYLVILMDRDVTTYLSNLEVDDLVTGVHSRTFPLKDASHRKEIINYLNETLIFSMQSLQWYGKFVTKNPGMTIDTVNKYLGVARLRQHRTVNITCPGDIINRTLCRLPYFGHPESRHFSEGWMPDNFSNQLVRLDHTWDYTDEWNDGSVKYVGIFAIYPGGGYIAALGRTYPNSMINLKYLVRNQWIDGLTRCLFVEFILYSPCTNLFNSVRIKFEMSTTGYIKQELSVHTAMLLFVQEKAGVMVWIILCSFIIVLIIFMIKLTDRLVRKKKFLLKDLWPFVDILIVIISLVCLILYIARSKVVKAFLIQVEEAKNNEFVNYFHLMYIERTLTIVAAILVFLATLRLWKLMRFLLIIKVVEKTLLLSAAPLLGLLLFQFIFILACTFYGVLRYGDHSYDFRGVFHTISTLFILSLNLYEDFNFEVISGLGNIYYSVFMIVMLGFYTLYIGVVTICYAHAQFYYSTKEDYNVVDYVKEQGQYYGELLKVKWKSFRLRGGGKKDLLDPKVYPKADEYRYANCATVPSSKMNGMAYVAKCVLRNSNAKRKKRITNADVDLIKQTLVNLFRENSQDKECFFISNIRGEKTRFVDDRVMLRMEKIVEALLTRDEDRAERERRRKLYRKIVNSHEEKMKDIGDSLRFLLNVLNVNVDI